MSAARKLKPTVSVETREYIARRARSELARRSLFEFVKQAWHVLEPGVAFESNWHIEAFCLHVQAMLEGWLVANGFGTKAMKQRVRETWESHGLAYVDGELLVQNLILNLPPITLKSRILMVFAPAWMWLHCPSWSLCAISSVDDNVKRDSHAHRDLVDSPWYRDTFAIDWTIRRGIDAVGEWMTTAGGERKSRTMLGKYTGVHVDAIFLDDPDDAHSVHSEPKRKEVQNKWTRAIKNRVKHPDRSIRIAIQQRVHIDDWTAAQISKGIWSPDDRKAWAWVVMPLQYGEGPKEAPTLSPWWWSDPRTAANDNMQPSRFSPSFIADEQRDKGPEGFGAQYNQSPAAFDHGMIKRAEVRFFRIEGDPPADKRPFGCGIHPETGERVEPFVLTRDKRTGELEVDSITVTVDASNGSEALTASAVGILVVACKGMMRLVLDDRTAVMSIDRMYDEVTAAVNDWQADRVLVELKAAGSSVINDLDKKIRDGLVVDADGNARVVEVEAYNPKNDSKEGRAAAMKSWWRQGLVYVRDGAPWLFPTVVEGGRSIDDGFIREVTMFPRGKRDDRIDALAQVIAYYSTNVDQRARWDALSRGFSRAG